MTLNLAIRDLHRSRGSIVSRRPIRKKRQKRKKTGFYFQINFNSPELDGNAVDQETEFGIGFGE